MWCVSPQGREEGTNVSFLFLEEKEILKERKERGNQAGKLKNPDRGVESVKTPSRFPIPFHSFAPELAALEWTEEGELAAAPRCHVVQRLLEAEAQSANQVELIRVAQPWCGKSDGESSPPKHRKGGDRDVSPGCRHRHPPRHRGCDVPPWK